MVKNVVLGVFVMLAGSASILRSSQASTQLTVCEVLNNLVAYRTKIIEVRGEFFNNSIGANCKPLKSGDYTWLNRILLENPENEFLSPEERPPWKLDPQVRKNAEYQLQQLLNTIAKNETSDREIVVATVIGRLDAPERLISNEHERNGYGHLNQTPARIIVKDIRDISITKGKTSF